MVKINNHKDIPNNIKKWFFELTDEQLDDLEFDEVLDSIHDCVMIDWDENKKQHPKPVKDKEFSMLKDTRIYYYNENNISMCIKTHYNENNNNRYVEYCEELLGIYIN